MTAFVALHDLEMAMGPTRFCESTAFPGWFPDGKWRPPEDENSGPDPIAREKLAQAPPVAPVLKAGDAVLMDSTTWHGGGGNVSSVRRTILSMTFVECRGPGEMSHREELMKLEDLINKNSK